MKRIMHRRFLGLMVIVSALILTACHKPPPPLPAPPAGPHPLTPHQKSLVSQIRQSGAKVVKQGEVLQIVMPTDTFFRRGTTRLKSNKIGAVKRMAYLVKSYIAPYRHPRVSVTGYTDKIFAHKTRKQLSTRYAREVAAYLWHRGVSQRWVRVRGAGASSPIASNRTPRGSAYNRRVVVRVN